MSNKEVVGSPKKAAQPMLRNERNKLRYFETKRIVLTREKKNYTQLIFMKATGDWVKAFGHSAVIFVQKIAPEIKSNAKLQTDRDYEVQSETGMVSLPNVEILKKKLEQAGIEFVEEKEGIYTFALGYRITPDEYNLMREQNQTLIERTGKMALPVVLMPNLLEDIKELFRVAFWEVRNMDAAVRELVGRDFVKEIEGMVVAYVKMARNTKSDVKIYLLNAMETIERVNGMYFTIDALRIVNEKKMFELAMDIAKVKKQIVFEMKRQGMKDIEAEYNGKIK